jgi:hypothetical protein
MKKVLFSAAIISANLLIHGEANAQASKITTLPGTDIIKLNTGVPAGQQTILSGNWTVYTDTSGKVSIADKDNRIVRVYSGAEVKALAGSNKAGQFASTSPFMLSVDKEGRLHIVDKTALVNGKTNVRMLHHDAGNFSDPDMPIISTDNDFVLNKED